MTPDAKHPPPGEGRRVIVHVGIHKTGSTWLQRDVFPLLDGVEFRDGEADREMLDHIADGSHRGRVRVDGPVLFSRESLAGRLWEPESPEAAAARVAEAFPAAEVLVFTRDPDEWMASVYAQYVNEGGWWDRQRFRREVPVARTGQDPHAVVSAFEERFDVVHVVAFEELRRDPLGVAEQVADLCGGELAEEPEVVARNRSMSRPVLAVLRVSNRLFHQSRFNPSPPIPIPAADRMRRVLYRWVDPLVPDYWR